VNDTVLEAIKTCEDLQESIAKNATLIDPEQAFFNGAKLL
jgi:hypothetical protein